MIDKPLWVKWYPGDFRSSVKVAQMSLHEEHLYRVLLDVQAIEGHFNPDPKRLAKVAKMTEQEFVDAWALLKHCFEEVEHGRWVNERMAIERADALESDAMRERRARKAAKAMWAKRKQCTSAAQAEHEQCLTPATQTQNETQTQTKKAERQEHAAAPPPVADAPVEQAPPTKARKPRVEPTGNHADLTRWWTEAWRDARGTEWAWSPKDFAALKAIRTLAKDDAAEIRRRGERMLAHRDRWIVENASPTTLRSKWNELGVEVTPVNGHHHNGRGQRVLIEDLVASGEIRIRGVNDHD